MAKKAERNEQAEQKSTAADSVTVELPIGDSLPNTYRFQRIDMSLDADQSEAMRRLMDGLRGREMKGGRFVSYPADVIRYILDRVHGGCREAGLL